MSTSGETTPVRAASDGDIARDLSPAGIEDHVVTDAIESPADRDIVAVDDDGFRGMRIHPPDLAEHPRGFGIPSPSTRLQASHQTP